MTTLFYYLFDDAASGTSQTTVTDVSGNNRHLNINFASGAGAWNSATEGRYLQCTAAAGSSAFSARHSVDDAGLGADLDGLQTATIIVRPRSLANGSYPRSPLVCVQQPGESTDLEIAVTDLYSMMFKFAGGTTYVADKNADLYAFVVDTTQATAADRFKVYKRNGATNSVATQDTPSYPSLNAALSGVNDSVTELVFFGFADAGYNMQGGIAAALGTDTAMSQAQVFAIFDALAADDDANPLAPPTLAFVSAPAITSGTITSSGAQIQLTTNLAATVKMADTAAGSSQPDASTFTGISSTGTTTGHSVFSFAITGQSPSTTRRKWLQVSDGTTTLYASVDVTTTAVTNNILSINNGNPIRHGQAVVQVTWDAAPETPGALTINGVAQTSHTGVNGTTTQFGPLVWPLLRCGETATLAANGKTATTPQFLPPVGCDYVTLSGYTEDPPRTLNAADILDDPDEVAVDGDQYAHSDTVIIAPDGGITFKPGFTGSFEAAIIDHTDGVFSDFETLYYGGSADLIPTIPPFVNLTNQEPGVAVVDSFLCADVDAGYDITFAAVGSMLVATSNVGPWLPSVTRQLGETVYRRMITGALGQTVTGGVSSGGVSSTCTYTTRAANAPVITTQPSNQTVTVNAPATFTIAGTNIGSRQWRINGVNVSGATGATFVHTPTAVGTYTITCVVQSPEGVSVTSNPATLTVIAVANRVLIPELRHRITGLLLGGTQNLPCYVLSDDRSQVLVPGTTINLAASGTTPLVNNSLGAVGTYVRVGFPDPDGTSVEVRLQVEA